MLAAVRRLATVFAHAMIVVFVFAPTIARAQATSAPSSTADDATHVSKVEATLARDASASKLWYFGWTAFYVGSTGVQLAVALAADDAGLRADARVGTVKSGLGLLGTVILPPPAIFFSPCTESEKATPEALAACRARQDERLDDAAKAERFGRSFLAHFAAFAVNIGGGVYSWIVDDRRAPAIIGTLVGIGLGELQILTRPTIARDVQIGFAPRPGGGLLAAGLTF